MGFYSRRNNLGNNIELSTEIQECAYEPGIEAAWAIVAESEANYNAIMQAVGIEELNAFEESGAEMVYEAGQISGFVGKAKEFFIKMWEKIKGLFTKFFAMFNQYTKSDKDFINKYKSHLVKINTRDFEYKGFNFTNLDLDIGGLVVKATAAANSAIGSSIYSTPTAKDTAEKINKACEDKTELVEKMRGAAIGESSLEAGEYTKELFKLFRSGEDSKETLDNIDVSNLIMAISENSQLKKNAEKSYKELEKIFKEALKTLNKSDKEMLKNFPGPDGNETKSEAIRALNNNIFLLKEAINISQIANGAKLTAIKDCNRQAKAICVALLNYKPKNESFNFGDGESVNEGGFLSNVVLR